MISNLFTQLPQSIEENEQFTQLLEHPGLRIERIVSSGQASPPDFWYNQPGGEWVLVVQGEAKLRFADEPEARHLKAGDFVEIIPQRQHRVDWTPADQVTIWLAIHY